MRTRCVSKERYSLFVIRYSCAALLVRSAAPHCSLASLFVRSVARRSTPGDAQHHHCPKDSTIIELENHRGYATSRRRTPGYAMRSTAMSASA